MRDRDGHGHVGGSRAHILTQGLPGGVRKRLFILDAVIHAGQSRPTQHGRLIRSPADGQRPGRGRATGGARADLSASANAIAGDDHAEGLQDRRIGGQEIHRQELRLAGGEVDRAGHDRSGDGRIGDRNHVAQGDIARVLERADDQAASGHRGGAIQRHAELGRRLDRHRQGRSAGHRPAVAPALADGGQGDRNLAAVAVLQRGIPVTELMDHPRSQGDGPEHRRVVRRLIAINPDVGEADVAGVGHRPAPHALRAGDRDARRQIEHHDPGRRLHRAGRGDGVGDRVATQGLPGHDQGVDAAEIRRNHQAGAVGRAFARREIHRPQDRFPRSQQAADHRHSGQRDIARVSHGASDLHLIARQQCFGGAHLRDAHSRRELHRTNQRRRVHDIRDAAEVIADDGQGGNHFAAVDRHHKPAREIGGLTGRQ